MYTTCHCTGPVVLRVLRAWYFLPHSLWSWVLSVCLRLREGSKGDNILSSCPRTSVENERGGMLPDHSQSISSF